MYVFKILLFSIKRHAEISFLMYIMISLATVGHIKWYRKGKKKCVPDVSLAINSQIKIEQNFENYTPKIEIH